MLFYSQRTGVSAVLKDTNLSTNYSVEEGKEKWLDIRLERSIMVYSQNNAPQEEATEL